MTADARRLERVADPFAGSLDPAGIFVRDGDFPAVGRESGARVSAPVAMRFGARGMSRRVVRATLNLRLTLTMRMSEELATGRRVPCTPSRATYVVSVSQGRRLGFPCR